MWRIPSITLNLDVLEILNLNAIFYIKCWQFIKEYLLKDFSIVRNWITWHCVALFCVVWITLKADVLFNRKVALKNFGNFSWNYVCFRALLLENSQTFCSEQLFHIKMTSPRIFSSKFSKRLDFSGKGDPLSVPNIYFYEVLIS